MTVRLTFTIPDALVRRGRVLLVSDIPVPAGSLATSPAMRRDYEAAMHRVVEGPEPCTYRHHDVDHPALIRLTPDPDPALSWAHQDVLTVCRCCAFDEGHLYEEMRGQARTSGHVGVELRQDDGRWV